MAALTGPPSRDPRERRGLLRHGVAGLATAGAAAGGQFALVLVVTRSLSPQAAGAFFTATSVCLMLAGVVRLDTGNGLVHALARNRSVRSTNGERRLVWGVLAPVAALAAVTGAGVAVAAEPLAGLTGVPGGVWVVLAAALPFVTLSDVLICATRGLGTMRPTLLLAGAVQPLGQLALVTAAVLAAAPPPVLAAAWALPSVAAALLAAYRLRGLGPYDVGDVSDFWRHTAPRSAAAALQSVFQRLDVVIVALLAGPAAAAVYTAATRFKVLGQLANQGLAQATQARLVRALAEGDLDAARAVYHTTTRWLIVLTWPLWLGYAAFAPWLLPLFGPAYADGGAIALVLSATMMVATACGMVDVVLVAGGRTAASLANVTTAVAVTIALDVLLVPAYGALGAALGWSGGVIVKNVLPLVQVSRHYGLRPFGLGRTTRTAPADTPNAENTHTTETVPVGDLTAENKRGSGKAGS